MGAALMRRAHHFTSGGELAGQGSAAFARAIRDGATEEARCETLLPSTAPL